MNSKGSGGPPRKTPWARRIISTLILLALLAGLVAGVVFAGIKVASWLGTVFQTEHQAAAERAAPKPVDIRPCLSADLEITLTPSSVVIEEGAGLDVGFSVVGKGEDDCSFLPTDAGVELVAETGPIWTPTACSAALADKTLLLTKGVPWSTALSWDGLVYADCAAVPFADSGASTVAPVGTYTLQSGGAGGKALVASQIVIN